MRSGSLLALALSLPLAACGTSEPPPQAPAAPPPPPAPAEVAPPAAPDAGSEAKPAAQPSAAPSLPASSPGNELSLAMLRALRAEKGNFFLSGASLRGALGMAALGAKGKTLDEMAQALRVEADPAKNAGAAKAEASAWRAAAGKAELVIANRLWVERAFPLEKTFSTQAMDGYGAAAENVDFAKAADPSRQRINKWVSDTTKGKIKDLLPGGSITPLTRVVLTNAVYFKGSWQEPFKKAATKDEPFQTGSGAVSVPTMHRTGTMDYAANEEVELVQLPYADSDLALLVALPRSADKLAAIESEVSGGEVDAWGKSLAPREVALSLPRFSFSWGRSVKPELQDLGVKAAFSPEADFSGVSKAAKDLYVSDVFHKAFVQVDEAGTEAAAATGVVMAVRGLPPKPTVMKVDHPFLFFVRSTKTGEILFAGRVANPKG